MTSLFDDLAEAVCEFFVMLSDLVDDLKEVLSKIGSEIAKCNVQPCKRPKKTIYSESQHFYKKQKVYRCRNDC